MTDVTMLDAPCDRCQKMTPELRPFKFSDSISFRGKVIEYPWLCWKCFLAEKRKLWKENRVTP